MLRYVGVLTLGFALASMAWSQTLPQGGRVSQGQVTISQSGQQMDITQSTSKAVVNWDSFDIGTHAKVNVVQPNSQSVLLNRVLSDNPTQILGQLQANGQVVLVNPKGIVVGSDGSVSASAFTASTLNISDADFMAGNGRYSREGSTGEVINRGRIQVAPGGYVALLGARVNNEGQIVAPQGAVALGAAETVTVPIGRTGKIKLELSPSSINASVANQKGGLIVAEGGQVYLQAAAIPSALASIVHSGRIDTSAAKAGEVHLLADGGHIRVDGQITANSSGRDPQNQPQPGGDIYIGRDKDSNVLAAVGDVSGAQLESQGGFVETSGQYLRTTGTRVLAKDWLLDPTDIKIVATDTATTNTRTVTSGGTLTAQDNTGILASEVLKSTIENAINSGTNVTISTANPTAGADGSGNITIETPLSFNNTGAQAATFRLFAVNGITQNSGSSITATGSQAVNIELVGDGRHLGVAASSASSRGIELNSTVSGNGNITITGVSRNTGSGFNGVYIANAVTTSAGTVQITGTATDAGGGAGAVIQGTVTASGNVTLDGRTANTSNRQGLVIQNTMSSTQGDIQVVGQTQANTQRAVAITINGSNVGKLQVSDGRTIGIQANTLLVNTGSTIQAGTSGTVNIQTLTSGNEIQVGADDTLSSTLASQKLGIDKAELDRISAGQLVIGNIASTGQINVTTATTTLSSTGNLTLRTGGTINVNQALTAGSNLTLQTNGGKIANSAAVSGVNVSIDNTNGTINASTGAITAGSGSAASGAAIEASGNITASGNLNLMGAATNTAGIQVNNRALSGANIQATGRVNNGGYGVLLNAGSSISSTASSGASLVKGINTAGGSNALISGAGVTFSAATGSTLTVWGDGTNTADRATRIDGGATTNGAVTIKGTSNNNAGLIVINGRLRANANSALTMEGTTSAAGQSGVFMVNGGGVEMSNGSTLQVTGQNTATTGTGRGVSLQGSGITKVSGATTTGDVSITGLASSTAAATGAAIEATVNTDGNITIDGTVGAAAGTGVSITSAVSSAGSAKSIQVTSNQGISHNGSLSVAGNTGTGSTIGLTSTLAGLTGAGSIGNTTSKNASVTVTQAGTSTFSGATNAANFTKAGAGALTLNSWTHTTAAATNISNAYTVSSGSLTLSPDGNYPALNPASVNVVNNATFSLSSTGNGTWKNTAFNFTGGLGGGTMNLQGNPIGDINTTNTFSTSGGATNTINGGLNANNANVTFSLAAASSGTTLHDGSFAALAFPSNSQGGFGLSNVGTLNIGGSGGVLFKDKLSATQINVNAGTLQMGDGSAATTAATADLTASQVAIGSNAKVIFQRAEATTSSTVFSGSGALQQAGAGTLTLTGNSSAFAGTTTVHNGRSLAIGTGGSLGASGSSLVLSDTSANVAFTNTSGTSTIGSTISGAGSLSKSGAGTGVITADNTYSGATTVSGGTLQVGNAGSTGTLGTGDVTLSNNANLHVLRAADTTLSNTISGAGNVSASITGTGSDLSVTGPVSLTGGTVNLVADGNLSVQQALSTTNTTDAAIVLTAGKPTNAGTSSGGDVSMSASGSLSTGTGGRATIYTGSLSGSTGLGIATGNNRYNSDESSTNYSAALGSGTYAIYREKPTITVLVNDASKTYDGVAFSGGSLNTTLSSGSLVRSDSFSAVTANATLAGTAQGVKNAGQYAITASETGGKNALGYDVTYTSGQLTIHKADLTVTANSVSKTYDGTTSATGTGTVGTLAGAAAGDRVNSSGSQAFLTSSAGSNKTVRASGVTIKDSANADMTGNYNILYTDNLTGTISKKDVTLGNITAAHKTYDGNTTATITSGSISGTVGSETLLISGSGTFDNKNAADGKTVTVSDVTTLTKTDGTGAWSNYNLTTTGAKTTTANITKKEVTLASITAAHKTYDGNTTATITSGSISGTVGSETLLISGSGTFDNKNVANGKTVTVSDVTTLTQTNGTGSWSNYNLTTGSKTTTANITPKSITLSGITADHKTYDGSTSATVSTANAVFNDKVSGDTLTVTSTGTFADKHAGNGKTVNLSNTLGGADLGNYTVTEQTTTSANITKKDVTLNSITASNKTYDGNTTATITSGSISGTVGSETLLISGSGSFDNKNAANGKTVTVSDVTTLTPTDGTGLWSNYNLTTTGAKTTTANISKKSITLSGITAEHKTYDGSTSATVSTANAVFNNKVNGDALTVTSTGTFADKNAGNGKTVNLSNTLGGADLGNYTVTDQTTTTANISKKDVTLDSITAAHKTYDGSATATISAGAISGTVASETLLISGSGTFDNKNAANGKTVTVSDVTTLTPTDGSGSWSNYNLTTTGAKTTTANITPKEVTLDSITAAHKTYNGNTTATITSGSISGTVGTETLAISGSGTFDNKNVANGKTVTVSDVTTLTRTDGTGSWSNYTLATGTLTTTANITKADLTVTANSVTKTYDGTTKATGNGTVGTLAGAAAGDVVNSAGSQAFLSSSAGNNKTVRASGVTIKDSANADMTGNYNITYTDNTTGVIQKANLTLTANDDARFVGLTDTPGYTGVSPSGLVNGEDMSVLGGTLTITRTNASTVAAGTYADVLSPSGLTSDNYNITFAKGTYTIVPADQLLIRNSNISATYGSTWSYDPTAKYLDSSSNTIITLSRTGSGNSFTFNDGLGTTVSTTLSPYSGTTVAGTSSAGHTVVGSFKIKDSNPTVVGSNFVGDPVFVGTLNVNTKALTPSTTGASMVYNGTTAMSNLSMDVTGKLGSDSVSLQGTGTYAQKHVGTNLNYTIDNLALSGTDAANYHIGGGISSITGNDGAITPATLKLSTSNVSKTYDGNTSASGTAVTTQNTQLFGNDSLSGGTFAFSNKNASNGDKVVQVSGVTVNDGNNGQNYNVSYVDNTTSTITKKDVTLASITAAHKTYDGNTTATITSGSISGTVGSETLLISGSGTFDNKNVANGKTVTVSDVTTLTQTNGTGSWSNYNLTTGSKTTTANITPKSITLSGITADHKTYDGSTSATVSTANAVFNDKVSGDTLTVTSTGTFADKHAGNGKTVNLSNTLGGADLGNYTVTDQTTTSANINKKNLTITGLSAVNKVYDGTTQASISSANAVFSGLISGDNVNLAATGTFDTRHVGDNKLVSLSSSLQGADAGNYNATTPSDLRANITPASLTVRAPTVVKTYDGTTGAPGTATVVGTLAGASAGDTLDSAALSFTDKNAGTNKTLTAHSALVKDSTGANVTGNYTIAYLHNTQSQITPATASISAPATSVIYNGQTQSQGEAVLNGFVAGDDVQAMGLASGRNAGTYTSSLSATGADVGNYTITYNNAALTIAKRPANLSALGQTVVYNGQTQSLNGSQGSGFVDGDALTFGGLPSGRNVGQYTSTLTVSGADAANYEVTPGSATLTITPKSASVTARPERVTYNGQTQQQSAAVLAGFVDGDDIQVSGLASGRNAGVYGSNVLASGQDVPNYSIRYEQGALTIDKAPLQFVGTSVADKVYDGNTQARVTAGTLSGLVGNETLNIDAVQGQFDSPEIGFAKPVQVVYGLSDGANGGLVSNYQWSPVTVQANITGSTTEHAPAPERIRQVNPFSRLSYLGFGGLVRTGATTGQLFYAIQNKDTRTCSPLQLEGCICEQPREQSLQVCYPAQVAQQAVK